MINNPPKPLAPRRKNSLKEQWDKTTKVVNIKQKFYSNGKYTDLQKATFTKWVNIQLRTIEEVMNESALSPITTTSFSFNKKRKKVPEIDAIDKDFRDGKKLLELLEILYENDVEELPKPERGKTRHHHIQNVNKVLKFLQKKLDDNGLTALKAIGPVDIVDGNVKLTLGLIWLIISKFHRMISNVFEVTEEELIQVEEGFKENVVKESELTTLDEEKEVETTRVDESGNDQIQSPPKKFTFEEFQSRFRKHFVESSTSDNNSILDTPTIFKEEPEELTYEDKPVEENKSIEDQPIDTLKPIPRNSSVRNRILSNSNNRLSLPPNYNGDKGEGKKKFNPNPPTRFRTLRLNSSLTSSPMSSSSGLLFWINMQLIDYASILPSTCYPIEDFIGMNDGIVLAALIHHLNMEWIDDFDLLIKDDDDKGNDKEIKIKERLTKCFDMLNQRLNVKQPKALVSMLIEKDYSDKERLKRTGLAWSVYISEIFLSITHTKNRQNEMRRQSRLIMFDENEEISESSNSIENNNNSYNNKKLRGCIPHFKDDNIPASKRNSMATSNLPPLPPWTPKASLISAVWDWTLSWINDNDDNDRDNDYDSDDYDKDGKLKEKEMRTIRRGNSSRKFKRDSLDIKNPNEWRKNESLNDDDPLQLLANTHQPALYMYWN